MTEINNQNFLWRWWSLQCMAMTENRFPWILNYYYRFQLITKALVSRIIWYGQRTISSIQADFLPMTFFHNLFFHYFMNPLDGTHANIKKGVQTEMYRRYFKGPHLHVWWNKICHIITSIASWWQWAEEILVKCTQKYMKCPMSMSTVQCSLHTQKTRM